MSEVSAILWEESIPIDKRTMAAAKVAGDSALDYALYGGEDFELVYTIPRKKAHKVEGIVVGEIIEGDKALHQNSERKYPRVYLKTNKESREKIEITRGGYDHFH